MGKETYPRYLDMEMYSKFKGLYSCNCHLFDSYEELRQANLQKFVPGQKVKHRCSGKIGTVVEFKKPWVTFPFPAIKNQLQGIEHMEELFLISKNE